MPTEETSTETLTPEAAQQQINARMEDSDFCSRYFNKYRDESGHRDAVSEMEALHAAAHPGPKDPLLPPRIEPEFKRVEAEGDKTEGEGKLTEAETEAAAALAQGKEEVEQLLGENAEERIAAACDWIGDEGFTAMEAAGFANDPQAIAELVDISERNVDGLLGAALSEYIGQGIAYGRAGLARSDLDADKDFQKIIKDRGDPRHNAAIARLDALALLEHPPAWARAAMEKYREQHRSP